MFKIILRLQEEITPLCEVKLVKKLTELLNSVEPMETTMKDAMRKAKAKLQREWSNFKEGYVIYFVYFKAELRKKSTLWPIFS